MAHTLLQGLRRLALPGTSLAHASAAAFAAVDSLMTVAITQVPAPVTRAALPSSERVVAERPLYRQQQSAVPIENGAAEAEFLLQNWLIAEPVAHYSPLVMSTRSELQQAFEDCQRTVIGDRL